MNSLINELTRIIQATRNSAATQETSERNQGRIEAYEYVLQLFSQAHQFHEPDGTIFVEDDGEGTS